MPWIPQHELDQIREIARERFARIEFLQQAHERERKLWETIYAEGRAENRRLVDTIIELRREGFDPAAATVLPPQPDRPQLPPEIRAAARKIAEPGSPLYRELIKDAEEQLRAGAPVPDILARIRLGASVLDDDQPAD